MKQSDPDRYYSTPTDPSLEFDILEIARLTLAEGLINAGRPALEAERIALYAIEGIRHVPKLLHVLTRMQSPTPAEIIEALSPVLDEAFALEKARSLFHLEDSHDIKKRTGRKKGGQK